MKLSGIWPRRTERRAPAAGLTLFAVAGMVAGASMHIDVTLAQDDLFCAAFVTYGDAQAYYAFHPEAQPRLDPDQDSATCETWFGIEVPAYLPGGPPVGGSTAGLKREECG